MIHRPRRNRTTQAIRNLVQEVHLTTQHLVYPLFLIDGQNIKNEIKSMPNIFQWSVDLALKEIEACVNLGIESFILFPVVDNSLKDKTGTYSYNKDNFYLKAIQQFKQAFPQCCFISDVALDPYSSDGHDGIVENGIIVNDATLEVLNKMALAQAQAGFDYIGPSDMMDGRVASIRQTLDDNGFTNTGILSYTAKYASAFYGPFRDALDSAPKSGDKKSYQMDYKNQQEALLEAELDTLEGADMLMVKPAMAYLDIIQSLKQNSYLPIVAYHVSGEYAMLKAAHQNGWLDYNKCVEESLYAIKRAGASVIITYAAKDFAMLHK
ncbi:MAG: porphobilinogen synthase [Chitinophagales bacterium]|nr:porphobilinogen synthase [Chitinophagales bacterium]